MKKKIMAKDHEASESKSIEYQADLEEITEVNPLINLCGDLYFTINIFNGDADDGDPDE